MDKERSPIYSNRYKLGEGVGLEQVREKIGWVNDGSLGGHFAAGHALVLAYCWDERGEWIEIGVCDEPIDPEGKRVHGEIASLIDPTDLP